MPQTDKSIASLDVLTGLEAYLDSLDGDPSAALAKIAGKLDPDSVKRRLGILLNGARAKDAAAEALAHEKSEVWIDLAIAALTATGAEAEAKQYLEWVRGLSKPAVLQRSAIAYCDGTMHWTLRNRADGERVVPGSLSPEEKDDLKRAAEVAQWACAPILASENVNTELEAQVLVRLFDVTYLLEERDKTREVVRVLAKRKPIPLKVAQAIVQEIAEPVDNIVDRLWIEHGDLFRPRFLACVIQARMFEDFEDARDRACQLVSFAKSPEDKEELGQLLYELSGDKDSNTSTNLLGVASQLLGLDSNLLDIFKTDQLLRDNDPAGAWKIIEASGKPNDPKWMRLRAIATLKSGKPLEALTLLQELAKFAPDPDLFKLIGDVARNNNREADEVSALDRLLVLSPKNKIARRRLSWLYAQRYDYKHAALHLEILHKQLPNDAEVTVNLAISYSFSEQHQRALSVLTDAAPTEDDFLIIKTRAQILHSQGRFAEAFSFLDSVRDQYWENPDFIGVYMSICHAADKEHQAHEALTKLLQLKEKGLVDDNTIQAMSFDDVKEIISGAAKRDENIKQYIVEGKFPWLLAAGLEKNAPYWSWTLRTQPISWLVDDAINRASHSIYSTNSFRVLKETREPATLTSIRCATKGREIVADLSALITLHSLGFLERAADFFGMISVPARYLRQNVADMQRLFPHQLSQKTSTEHIKAAVDRKGILVDGTEAGKQPLPVLDEYQDEVTNEVTLYRLRDLFSVLHDRGLVTDSQRSKADSVAHKEPVSSPNQAQLQLGDRLRIGEMTLMTLSGIDMLDTVTKHFSVHISQNDLEDVLARFRAFQALHSAQTKHKDLWNTIHTNSSCDTRFKFIHMTDVLAISNDEKPDQGIAIAAFLAAKENNLPLLADDRVCQALLLNEWKDNPVAAFGTDCLLLEMAKSGAMSNDEATDALLQLIEWRYRFILFPPASLKLLADRYRSHPPGLALRKVADYVHDCMRDEGLFGGPEPVTPPISIAMRLYQSWVHNISEFVMDMWLDETVDQKAALELTNWAMTELLPSSPHILDYRFQLNIALLTPRTVITRALIRASGNANVDRAHQGLRAMAAELGLDETEYQQIVVGAVSGV